MGWAFRVDITSSLMPIVQRVAKGYSQRAIQAKICQVFTQPYLLLQGTPAKSPVFSYDATHDLRSLF